MYILAPFPTMSTFKLRFSTCFYEHELIKHHHTLVRNRESLLPAWNYRLHLHGMLTTMPSDAVSWRVETIVFNWNCRGNFRKAECNYFSWTCARIPELTQLLLESLPDDVWWPQMVRSVVLGFIQKVNSTGPPTPRGVLIHTDPKRRGHLLNEKHHFVKYLLVPGRSLILAPKQASPYLASKNWQAHSTKWYGCQTKLCACHFPPCCPRFQQQNSRELPIHIFAQNTFVSPLCNVPGSHSPS